jgi:peptidoglycan/xylan/chitin deacetylase (PgdA/CDA1 family)
VDARDRLRLLRARRLERQVRRSPAVRGAALVLHGVAPEVDPDHPAVVPPWPAAALDALTAHVRARYRPVRAGELLEAARARRAGERIPVAITFDDDLVSHLDVAAPLLDRHGVPGTAFLTGNAGPFWWQSLQAAADAGSLSADVLPMVDPALVDRTIAREPRAIRLLARAIEDLSPQVKREAAAALGAAAGDGVPPALDAAGREALLQRGWEVGWHTHAHPLMPALDDRALAAAADGATAALPGVDVRAFAYPHGKAGAREAAAVRDAGYAVAFTGTAGVVTERTDPHLVPRLDLRPGTPGAMALAVARALAA